MLDSRRDTANFFALFPSEGGEKGDVPSGAQTTLNHILSSHGRIFLDSDETNIPAVEHPTQTQARFPRTYGHQGRSQDFSRSSRTRPSTTHSRLSPSGIHDGLRPNCELSKVQPYPSQRGFPDQPGKRSALSQGLSFGQLANTANRFPLSPRCRHQSPNRQSHLSKPSAPHDARVLSVAPTGVA